MLGTFFTISSGDVNTMTAYIGNFIDDFKPLLLPIIAVLLGLLIVWAILSAVRGH